MAMQTFSASLCVDDAPSPTSADGDKKAYSESSQYAIKMKKDTIKWLREENKNLRAKLSRKMEVRLIMSTMHHKFICKCTSLSPSGR